MQLYIGSVLSLIWILLPFILIAVIVALIVFIRFLKSKFKAELQTIKSKYEEEITIQNHDFDLIEQEHDLKFKKLSAELYETNCALKTCEERLAGIIAEDQEIERLKNEQLQITNLIEELRASYTNKRALMTDLEEQVSIYQERSNLIEVGVYEPHFDFSDTEAYKDRIKKIREFQKNMISEKMAVITPKSVSLDGSLSKGKAMIDRQARLTLRAFNNESEAAIANTRWNNVVTMEKRILSAEKLINKENSSMGVKINERYVELKLEELRLTHEYRERLKQDKNRQLEIAQQEREERRLQTELDTAKKEEDKYQALLEKARREANTEGETSAEMSQRIRYLELALSEAHKITERAQAMAERTKSGYVYVISNIGSFGEDVIKIGLTRRLNPDDRVKELGDASVPFTFDIHAIIYSDEAPALEFALHQEFADRRINTSNMRKEFFRVSVDEVERAVAKLAPEANFFKDREAQEWNETVSRRKQLLDNSMSVNKQFPEAI